MFKVSRTFLQVVAALFACVPSVPAYAQRASSAKADAPLVVDGAVQRVFRAEKQGQNDYLVQIDVSRSEARKSAASWGRSRSPAPGESVYVLIPPRTEQTARVASQASPTGLPEEGSKIRAYLSPGEQGGWQAASVDWYETTGGSTSGINPDDLVREALEKSKESTLGMTTELLRVDGRMVVRVTSVERGGPAQGSGLEVGDVITSVDGAQITSAKQLADLAAKGKKLSLVVVDVNTGRGARVEIDPKIQTTTADARDAPQPQPARVSLGLSAEPVTLGTRSALKVISVDPAGPAAKAGIEAGDIVVAANGVPTTGVEQLLSALRKSGPALKLTVRDSRTSRDVDVEVNLDKTASAPPSEAEAPTKPSGGRLGAVTELAFHDNDFAVKVTEVEPNSAAARAGLKPGTLIVAADGKPVLHPNDLNDAMRKSPGTIRLTVVEAASGRKGNVDISLR